MNTKLDSKHQPAPWTVIRESTGMTDNDYLRKHYAGVPTSQLTKILYRGADAICKQAAKLGIGKTPKRSVTDQIMQSAAGPTGFRAVDLPRHDSANINRQLDKLVAAKQLIKATLSFRHVRYFVHDADAKSMLAKFAPKPTAKYGVVMIKGRSRTGLPEWKNAEPYFDPKKPPKITIAPKPARCWKTNTFGMLGG